MTCPVCGATAQKLAGAEVQVLTPTPVGAGSHALAGAAPRLKVVPFAGAVACTACDWMVRS